MNIIRKVILVKRKIEENNLTLEEKKEKKVDAEE